jgi:stage III sporulation protein AD
MEIIQVVGLGIIATVLILIVKEQKPLFAFLLAVATSLLIFLFLIGKIGNVISMLEDLAENSGVQIIYLKTVLKIIGSPISRRWGRRSFEMPDRNRSHPK